MCPAALTGQPSGGCAVHPACYVPVEKSVVLSSSFLPQIIAHVHLQPLSLLPSAVTQFQRTTQLQKMTSVLNMFWVFFFNSLATVIYYNSLKWLLRDLSLRHHYQVIFWLVQVQTRRHSHGHPLVTIVINFPHITPEGDTKHSLTSGNKKFYKSTEMGNKNGSLPTLQAQLQEHIKWCINRWPEREDEAKMVSNKGLCHFLLVISEARCRPAVIPEPRSSLQGISVCIRIFLWLYIN